MPLPRTQSSGPKKPFSLGINCVARTRNGNFVVGCGDGTVAALKADDYSVIRCLPWLCAVLLLPAA